MDYRKIFYPEFQYGEFTDIDGVVTFFCRVNSLIEPSSIVLDVGCGRGSYGEDPVRFKRELRILKGKCKRVIGIDVDDSAKFNPFIDEFYLIKDNSWPLPDNSVDICICNAVLEHVEEPDTFFAECQRVIKLNGVLCLSTANIYGYAALFSKIIPKRFHKKILNKIQPNRKDIDVFPTYYRCNTLKKLRKMLDKYGFDHCVYGYEAEPSYLSFSKFVYRLGVLHQKIALNIFKLAIFVFARKR